MTDHAELRRLAKAATPGPWRVQTGCSWRRIGTDSGDGDVLRPCTHPHDGWPDIVAPAENLKYIASANPKTILALLDEIDGLSDELSACTEHPGGCGYWREAAKRRAEERDRLRDENEVLRRFAAEAYQVLGALDAPENVLDNASDAANGLPLRHETLLPFFAEDYEALRNDAARYRWLRERDLETIRQGGVFAGMTPENIVLNQEDLDAAIDAALEGATQ
ncbi:ead/Ea22-like family protein [Pseudomonas aeruginosa]|nr:ead/Ea22-like family protein [Pseudomonas aeruginosa]